MDFSLFKKVDSRIVNIPLIDSDYKIPLILFVYLYLMLVYGPRFMKNRPPYSLKTFIQLYNIVQFVTNAWLVYSFVKAGLITRKLFCPIELDYTNSPAAMKAIGCARIYFLLKLLDLAETGIFVLRKKNNQVSGLHLYHHVSTILITWFSIRYYCVIPLVFISMINSTVHMIMYIYYFLAACGPDIRNNIAPIKRWITIIQMVQFTFIILYMSQNFIPHCNVISHWSCTVFIQNIVVNFFLFYNFYRKTYRKSKKIQ